MRWKPSYRICMIFTSTLAALALTFHTRNETNTSTTLRGLPNLFDKGMHGKTSGQQVASSPKLMTITADD